MTEFYVENYHSLVLLKQVKPQMKITCKQVADLNLPVRRLVNIKNELRSGMLLND